MSIPKTDREAMGLFAELVLSVHGSSEAERVAAALILGTYYGAAKDSASKSGLTDNQTAIVCAAYSYALEQAKGVLGRVYANSDMRREKPKS